jgi:hypothetical protein
LISLFLFYRGLNLNRKFTEIKGKKNAIITMD